MDLPPERLKKKQELRNELSILGLTAKGLPQHPLGKSFEKSSKLTLRNYLIKKKKLKKKKGVLVMEENRNVKIDGRKMIMSAAELAKADDNNRFVVIVKTGDGKAQVNVSATGAELIEMTGHLLKSLAKNLVEAGCSKKQILNIISHLCAHSTYEALRPNTEDILDILKFSGNQQEEE